MGREMLDPADFAHFLVPFPLDLHVISDSSLAYHPPTHPTKPGWPANPRMQLCRLLLQEGQFLDYYTGEHAESSLSNPLRKLLEVKAGDGELAADAAREMIPNKHLRLFPQYLIDSSFPPTFIMHGENDSAVRVTESLHLKNLLDKAGVQNELRIIEGEEHSFDYAKGATEKYASLFDEAFHFVDKIFGRY